VKRDLPNLPGLPQEAVTGMRDQQDWSRQTFGVPTESVLREDIVAAVGKFYRLDGGAARTVFIPYGKPGVVGQSFTVVNPTSGGAVIKLLAQVGDTVNGGSSKSVGGVWDMLTVVCIAPSQWAVLRGHTGGVGGGAGTPIVNYLSGDKPPGFTGDYIARYQPDATADDQVDRTGNSHDLSAVGAAKTHTRRNGLLGWSLRYDRWFRSAVDAGLVNAGAFTVEALLAWSGATSADDAFFGVGVVSDPAEADNWQVLIQLLKNIGNVGVLSEHGGGFNDPWVSAVTLPQLDLIYCAVTRAANGKDYEIFFDAVSMDSGSTANAPTGGANSRIWVGGYDSGSDYFGEIYGLRYSNAPMILPHLQWVDAQLRAA